VKITKLTFYNLYLIFFSCIINITNNEQVFEKKKLTKKFFLIKIENNKF